MALTIERKVLQERYISLYKGLQYSVDDILPLMKHHSLLPMAVITNASNPGMLISDKLTLILSALETQVEMDKQAFHTFLDQVLAEKPHLSMLYQQLSLSYRLILRSQEKKDDEDEPTTDYDGWTVPTDQSEYPTPTKSELLTNSDNGQTPRNKDSGISTQLSGLQAYADPSSQMKDQVERNTDNCQSTVSESSLCSIHSLPVKVISPRPNILPMTDKDLPSPLGSSTVHSNPAKSNVGSFGIVVRTPLSKEETRNQSDPDPVSLSSQSSVTSSCMGCEDAHSRMKEMEREMAKMSLKLSQQESVIEVDSQHYLKKVEEYSRGEMTFTGSE